MEKLSNLINFKKKQPATDNIERWQVNVSGIVQGVGFRPFVLRSANKYGISGFVLNLTGEVRIEAQGSANKLISFVNDVWEKAPRSAQVNDLNINKIELAVDEQGFSILPSLPQHGSKIFPSPDIALCDECGKEMLEYGNNRYMHPFISCTDCGPRYSIQKSSPYDRDTTTMTYYDTCESCSNEYKDINDRRLHSQTNCCHHCGPSVSMHSLYHPELCVDNLLETDVRRIKEACELLENDGILMIKGVGGYHLACKATSSLAVLRMRQLKQRPKKPLAIMTKNLAEAYKVAEIGPEERRLLTSPAAPIVILNKRKDSNLSTMLAPGSEKIGIMLAYTPLHQVILNYFKQPIVLTSANLKGNPIEYSNKKARERLSRHVDCVIDNNREIVNPLDDSVAMVLKKQTMLLRRSRGYVPESLNLDFTSRPMLACGGDIKSTFCLSDGQKAFLGPYTGDLDSWPNFKRFVNNINNMRSLLDIQPTTVVHDMHPHYKSTEFALSEYADQTIAIQHHHAHIVSCMVEKQLDENVIGVAFDGSGWGLDGNVWGGEFMISNREKFVRAAHLRYMPMPGGDQSAKKPYRMAGAISQMVKDPKTACGIINTINISDHELSFIEKQVKVGINTPYTSSMGRLFDIIAAITGISREISYEAEAAIELEELAGKDIAGWYDLDYSGKNLTIIDYEPMLTQIITDISEGLKTSHISAKFHNTIANMIYEVCSKIRDSFALDKVVLSGGVFQNRLLLQKSVDLLEGAKFDVHFNNMVPINDNGIAIGQMAIANQLIASKDNQQCA